jgi:hypothetical protein
MGAEGEGGGGRGEGEGRATVGRGSTRCVCGLLAAHSPLQGPTDFPQVPGGSSKFAPSCGVANGLLAGVAVLMPEVAGPILWVTCGSTRCGLWVWASLGL